jgi:hypothetical protein
MRGLRRKAVYAYQFIPLRRGATPARNNFTVDTSERMHGFALLPSAAPAGAASSEIERDRTRNGSEGILGSSGVERNRTGIDRSVRIISVSF